ncbi:hypothetical protein Btru_078044 [Bulinus truncatus]|nr:hypothetical protein Btru_078044 [Bulinus truncatus]
MFWYYVPSRVIISPKEFYKVDWHGGTTVYIRKMESQYNFGTHFVAGEFRGGGGKQLFAEKLITIVLEEEYIKLVNRWLQARP